MDLSAGELAERLDVLKEFFRVLGRELAPILAAMPTNQNHPNWLILDAGDELTRLRLEAMLWSIVDSEELDRGPYAVVLAPGEIKRDLDRLMRDVRSTLMEMRLSLGLAAS